MAKALEPRPPGAAAALATRVATMTPTWLTAT